MLNVTMNFTTKVREITNELFKQNMSSDNIKHMSTDEFVGVKMLLELQDASIEMMEQQAEIIDKLDARTRELLEINKRLLERAEGL